MRKFFAVIALYFLAVSIHAQTNSGSISGPSPTLSSPAEVTSTSSPSPTSGAAIETGAKATLTKNSRVEIPAEKARPVNIPKINPVGITIDGRPDEEMWKTAALFKDFYQTSPGDNISPSKPTEVLMMYDEKNLYVAFKCWDEKDKIRASVAKRDNVYNEDNVRMWIDTYNDQRRAYVLGFNPFGIQQDGIYTEGIGADFSVDIVMESKGVIEEWGWSVEVKIPFKSLRYSAGKGKLWGFNAARNIDRFNDEFDQWLPDDRNVSGFLIKHGKISGLDGIKYERTLEVVPSITVSETGLRKRTIPISTANALGYDPIFNPVGLQDPGKFINDPIKQDLGVNLKYTLNPNVTLDAAINPDYAEIEADAAVVTANQRFPIFFQEKRPFFLEGKEIFDSALQPFYSRTIVDPDFAAKLTGKTGKNTYGFLVASDNAPGNYSEDERGDPIIARRIDPFVDENAFFSVLRLKRDIGKENSIGFFGTARIFPQNRNFVGGFDGKVKINPQTTLTFQALGTHSRKWFYNPDINRSEYRTGNGLGYYVNLDHTTDLHGWTFEAIGRSKDYRADAGFTKRTNTNSFFFANRFSTKSDAKAKLIRASWTQFGRYAVDWKGRIQEGLIGNNFNFTLQGNLFVYTEVGMVFEKIYEEEFGARRDPVLSQPGGFYGAPTRSAYQPYFSLNFNKTVNKKLSTYGFVGSIINAFDYDFGAGNRYPRTSQAFRNYLESPEYNQYIQQLYAHQANPDVPGPASFPFAPALDPGRGWQFDLNLGGEYKPIEPLRVSLDYTKSKLIRNDNNGKAFDTNIFSLRSTYQFTRFTYIRLRADYDTLTRNMRGQFLFGWNPNPGTAFYVGYNDDFNYHGYSPFTDQHEPGFERNGRTFFIRASYLFRKSY
ncbi:MAG: hypothetical protein DMF63_07455 [Acidobacteria bacterium]|nr:MAG: hypothetical protein DMF63_07455 [Acidobacteriota bacterium]